VTKFPATRKTCQAATPASQSGKRSATQIRISKALVVPIVVLAVASCKEKQTSPQLQEVRVAKSAFLSNAPIFIGEKEGYFAEEGIRIKFVDLPQNSVSGLPALSKGDVDAESAAVSIGFFNAVLSGSDVRIVADRSHFDPSLGCESFGIVGRKSLFENKPVTAGMLRGRVFSMNAVGQTGYLAELFLKKYGLKISDVKVVRMPPTAERPALDAGTVDIVARSDPFFFNMMQGGHTLLSGGSSLAPGSHLAVLVYGPSLLRPNRQLGEKFMIAYLRAVRKSNEGHTDSNIATVSAALGLDSAQLRKMCWPHTDPNGAINFESLTNYEKWGVETGNLARVLDPSAVTDTMFIAKASRALNVAH